MWTAYLCWPYSFLGCLGQAEACIIAILKTLEIANKSDTPSVLNDFLPNFLSYIIVVPQNTIEDYSLTQIVRRVLKSANNLTNMSTPSDQALLISLYIKAIRILVVSHQQSAPYHIGMFIYSHGKKDTPAYNISPM